MLSMNYSGRCVLNHTQTVFPYSDSRCSGQRCGDRRALGASLVLLLLVIAPFVSLSASRVIAQRRNYGGSIQLHAKLFEELEGRRQGGSPDADRLATLPPRSTLYEAEETGVRVCLGGEWYRFPSSFFLPETTALDLDLAPPPSVGTSARPAHISGAATRSFTRVIGGPAQPAFIRSSFKGQLPQPFLPIHKNGTQILRPNFNDVNREEADRYVSRSDDESGIEQS